MIDRQMKRRPSRARHLLMVALASSVTVACPPDNGKTEQPAEERGSKENLKSGAGNDSRSLQDISGAERGNQDSKSSADREPGGR
jgi:hypothetical protein